MQECGEIQAGLMGHHSFNISPTCSPQLTLNHKGIVAEGTSWRGEHTCTNMRMGGWKPYLSLVQTNQVCRSHTQYVKRSLELGTHFLFHPLQHAALSAKSGHALDCLSRPSCKSLTCQKSMSNLLNTCIRGLATCKYHTQVMLAKHFNAQRAELMMCRYAHKWNTCFEGWHYQAGRVAGKNPLLCCRLTAENRSSSLHCRYAPSHFATL